MRLLHAAIPLLLVALALSAGAAPTRDERESLQQIERRVNDLARNLAEIEPLLLRLDAIRTQTGELEAAVANHRRILTVAEGAPRPAGWLHDSLVFLLGVAAALAALFAHQLLRGYDEAPLPPEARSSPTPAEPPPAGGSPASPRSEGIH